MSAPRTTRLPQRPLPVVLSIALLVAPGLLAACVTDQKAIIECAGDADCEGGETCVDDICLPCSAIVDRQRRLFPGCDADEVLCETEVGCGVTLRCVNTSSDLDHCGACNQACPAGGPNTDMLCSSSTCLYACRDGFLDIDGQPGCEYECRVSGETTSELCDGIDNDCNGLIDSEDARFLAPPCPNGSGVCALATAECREGVAAQCSADQVASSLPAEAPAYEPELELACDLADNDCDGLVDEPCCSPPRTDALDGATGPATDEAWNVSGLTFGTVAPIDQLTWTTVSLDPPRRVALERDRLCREPDEEPVYVYGRAGDADSVVHCVANGRSVLYPTQGGAAVFSTDDDVVGASVSAAGALNVLTVRTTARATNIDHLVTWRNGATRDASAPFGALTLPTVAAGLNDEAAVLVADTAQPNVAAHVLGADGAPTGERISLLDAGDGLVTGAPIRMALAPSGRRFLAFSAGDGGREVFAKPLGESWRSGQPQARALGRVDGPIRSLRVVPADEGVGVLARTDDHWFAWLVEPLTGDLLEERIVERGDLSPTVAGVDMWRAAWSSRVLIIAMVDEGGEWQVARFGTTGDRICSSGR